MDAPDARHLKQLDRALKRDRGRAGAESTGGEGSLRGKVITPGKLRIAITEARFVASSRRRPPEHDLRKRLRDLAENRPRWAYRRLYVLLKKRL